MPEVSKMTIIFKLLKVSKMVSVCKNIYITSHGEAGNIKFGQQVNLIQRVLDTFPQELLTSSLHI